MNLSININCMQMIDCIYSLLVLHRLMFDWEFMVVFCLSTLNDSLERSPIEQQTELAKQEPSMIAGNVKPQLAELSLNLAIKHLTCFFNLCLPPAPSPVTVIKKEKTSRNSVSLSWQKPERPNGIILDYEIKYYEKVGAGFITGDKLHSSSFLLSWLLRPLEDAAKKKKKNDLEQVCEWNMQLLLWRRPPPFTSQSVSNAVLPSPSLPNGDKFTTDSKCVCEAAHSSVKEISAERIAAAFSTNTAPRLTFYGEISPPRTFNHPGSFSMCVYVRGRSRLLCAHMPRVAPNLLISRPTEAVSFLNPVLCSAILT